MRTDYKFRMFLKEHLGMQEYAKLLSRCNNNAAAASNFITAMSAIKLSDDVLILVEQFLSLLSPREVSTYVSEIDSAGNSIFLLCKNVDLMKIIIKYIRNINAYNNYDGSMLQEA